MQITGTTSHGENVLLYQNTETATYCPDDRQKTTGTSVCDLTNSDKEVRALHITVFPWDMFFNLCEVQLYAGMC